LLYENAGATIKLYLFYCFKDAMTTEPTAPNAGPALDAEQIRDSLRQVIDPEVGRDIVALGLVYNIVVAPERLFVEMTMTSPACPLGEMLLDEVHAVLAQVLPETLQRDVRLVWEPPWNPSMMDEATKLHFGWEPE